MLASSVVQSSPCWWATWIQGHHSQPRPRLPLPPPKLPPRPRESRRSKHLALNYPTVKGWPWRPNIDLDLNLATPDRWPPDFQVTFFSSFPPYFWGIPFPNGLDVVEGATTATSSSFDHLISPPIPRDLSSSVSTIGQGHSFRQHFFNHNFAWHSMLKGQPADPSSCHDLLVSL